MVTVFELRSMSSERTRSPVSWCSHCDADAAYCQSFSNSDSMRAGENVSQTTMRLC